jgi:beta-lactamase class A
MQRSVPKFGLDRRAALTGAGALALARPAAKPATDARYLELEQRLKGGRLGVFAIRGAQWRAAGYRHSERFPMCSTFKASLAAAVLQKIDRGEEHPDRVVQISVDDLLAYAPVTQANIAEGMPVTELCRAAVEVSDNTAANLLLPMVGGPAGLTRFWRAIGDGETRLDRNEPTLNDATPGDPRDTTTPAAMARNLQRFAEAKILKPGSRRLLAGWMAGATTGLAAIRAGAPKGWRVGDKTGNGGHNSSNDIAVLTPPKGQPIYMAVYTTGGDLTGPARQAVIAEAARIAISSVSDAHG